MAVRVLFSLLTRLDGRPFRWAGRCLSVKPMPWYPYTGRSSYLAQIFLTWSNCVTSWSDPGATFDLHCILNIKHVLGRLSGPYLCRLNVERDLTWQEYSQGPSCVDSWSNPVVTFDLDPVKYYPSITNDRKSIQSCL